MYNKIEDIRAKIIKVYDSTDKKIIVNLNNLIYYKQPQIRINDEKLFENPSQPPSSETISDNHELTSTEINQSLPSVEDISDIFPALSDEYQHPNFTNFMPHSSELEQLTKSNIVNYSNSSASFATPESRNILIVPPISSTLKCKKKKKSLSS